MTLHIPELNWDSSPHNIMCITAEDGSVVADPLAVSGLFLASRMPSYRWLYGMDSVWYVQLIGGLDLSALVVLGFISDTIRNRDCANDKSSTGSG